MTEMIAALAPPYAVESTDLFKQFGDNIALDGLSISVPENSVYLLVGENGAGKTTLMRAMLDLVRPSRGKLNVVGEI